MSNDDPAAGKRTRNVRVEFVNDRNKETRSSRSETFKNYSVGIAAFITAAAIPVITLSYTAKQNELELASKSAQHKADLAAAAQATAREAAEKDRELGKEYISLGVQILSSKATGKQDPVREWAVKLIDHYSDIKLTLPAQKALEESTLLQPHLLSLSNTDASVLRDSGYTFGTVLSRFNRSVDYSALSEAGITFSYIKASSGMRADPTMLSHIKGSLAAHLAIGLFHFFIADQDPDKQALLFIQLWNQQQTNLPPVVDLEPFNKPMPVDYADRAFKFISAIQRATGVTPIIYSYRGFSDENLDARFSAYPLFLADYSRAARAAKEPKPSKWWKSITLWDVAEGGADPRLSKMEIVAYRGRISSLEKDTSRVSR